MSVPPRVIPCLLVAGGGLYKTERFERPQYVGDPINAVRVFNDKEVDELILLDIEASPKQTGLDLELIEDVVSEAFMPICYGGGVTSIADFDAIFKTGVEKVAVNSAALANPNLISEAAARFGSQSVVVGIDATTHKKKWFTRDPSSGKRTDREVIAWARECERLGAGELVITSVDREGTRGGYDLDLVGAVASAATVPVLANGGAGSVEDFRAAFQVGAAGAVAGTMFVFNGPRKAVLISYPSVADRIALRG